MKHKSHHESKVMDQKISLSSENEDSDYTATETSSMSEGMRKKSRKSTTQFSVLRSDTDGLRMKISAIRRKTTDSKQVDIKKCSDNNNLEVTKLKIREHPSKLKDSMSAPLTMATTSDAQLALAGKSSRSIFLDESDSRSEASNNGKIKKIKLKRKKAAKMNETNSKQQMMFTEERKKSSIHESKERSLTSLNQSAALPDDNIGLSSSDNELPALVNAAIKCVESDSDSLSVSTQPPKIQYTLALLKDFMEKTQMLSADADKTKASSEKAPATSNSTNLLLNGTDVPVKKKRGRPKKIQNPTVVNESADSGVVSSTAQSTSPSPKIHLERSRSQARTEKERDTSPPKIDIVNLDKRMYAMNERVLYPPPRSKIRKQSTATKQTNIASTSSSNKVAPKPNKDDMLDPVWRKIDVNSKFRRPSVSGYKSDGAGGSTTICSKILTAKSGYASDYGVRSNHYSGYKSDASGKSRCSMRSCYSRVSRAKSCDGKRRTKFRRKRKPTINHSKSVGNLNEQDILQLAGLSLGQSSEESSGSAVCKPKILAEEAETSNVYKKYGEINRYVTTGEYFGRSKATNFSGTKNLDNSNADQESQDQYTFLGAIGSKLYARSRKGSVTGAELPLNLGSSRKLKSRRSSLASFCSSSFYSGVSKSKRRRRRKSLKFGCSKMVVVDSKLLTEIEIITNSFPSMCRIHCDKPVGGSYVKEKIANDRVAAQKAMYQNKRNLKKRKISENVDFALSSGINIAASTTSKRRHKKACNSSPDDHKLPLKKRHYLLTPGEKTEKSHAVAYVAETLKSQKESVEPKASGHMQKPNARTVSTRAAITPKKRHLLQTSASEGGSNSPNYFNDTKLSGAVKAPAVEIVAPEVVNSKKRNRLEGLVTKIANATCNSSGELIDTSPSSASVKDQTASLPMCSETSYPPPGIFEPSVELEIQIPMTKLGEASIITKSEVESPLDLLDMHNKTFPESSSHTKVERVVESLLNKTGGNLILKRKRKKINRTGFPNVKKKKRKVSELSVAAESDRKSETDSKAEAFCDRVPHSGETSDTFLERNRTPRLSVVSLERLQGTNKKQMDTTPTRTRSTKPALLSKNKPEPLVTEATAKTNSNKQLAKPLSKKKGLQSSKEPLKIAINPLLHITFPTCKIRLKRRLEASLMTNVGSLIKDAKETINEPTKPLPLKRAIVVGSKKTESETIDFLEQEPLPPALYDIANAIDSESSSSASVLSEDSKSTNRKQKWKKNYLVAGLLSEYYKVNNSNTRGKKMLPNQSKENNNEVVLCPTGPLLPPPPYCEKFFRRTEFEFQLPYDIWWAYTNDKLPPRVTVPSWNYRKIRTNVYRGADIRPNTTNIDRPTCNCKSDIGCGDDCLNRMVYTECYPSSCPTREKCQNQKIQRHEVAPGVERFMTENKGWGVRTKLPIKKGTYILEYVGEVVTEKEFKERMATLYANDTHHYCLHLDGGLVIDGHRMGSDGRFVNHSCSPNCEMQKWSVNGLSRMALFAARNIDAGEEISYDYNFSLFNPSEGQECRCNTPQCRGVIGGKSQRIKPLLELPKSIDMAAGVSSGRRNGRQRKRLGSARKDVVRLQSKDIVMTQVVQQLSEKDKRLIKSQRLFLIKNFEKVRRIRSKGVPSDAGKVEQVAQTTAAAVQRRPSTPSSLAVQISALRSPRNMQTRGLTQAVQDPEVEKMAKMAVIFRDICSTLETIRDKADKPQIVRLYSNPVRRKGKPAKQPLNAIKRKNVDFSTIQVNIEKGFYKDPVEFDDDIEYLFKSARELNKDNEENLQVIKKLSDLYSQKKSEVYALLLELAADKKSLKNFGPNAGADIPPPPPPPPPPPTGVVSKNFSAKGKQTKSSTEDIIACICGLFKDEGLMIQCARCMVWQHTECTKADVNADSYLCERCDNRVVDREIPLDDFTEDGHRYYLSLVRGDLQIRQGDTVYVLRDIPIKDEKGNVCSTKKHTYETIGEIDYSECDIFRVERLWKDANGKRVIFGHHFLRPHETFHEPSRRFYPNEVVRVPLYEVVPIELVIGRCWVLDRTTFCNGRPADCTSEEHVFICELRVDKSARFFSKAKVNWPICTKNYAFKRFAEKLKVSKSYAPHDVDPSLIKQRKQKSENESTLTITQKSTAGVSSTKKPAVAVQRKKIILPLRTRKQKRNHLEIVLAAIKKLKSKNTQMHANVLDVSYLLSGRGARQRKSMVTNLPT